MALKKHKSISRIDQPEKHTHGWYVRVHFKGRQIAKFVPDKQNGGKKKALTAAIKFRDDTEEEIGKPRTERPVVARKARKKTEVIGVRHVIKITKASDGEPRENPVYEVTWSPRPNVVQRTSVSIRKYGKREAFRRACEIRRQKEEQFYGTSLQH
jgi:hypothetical protein